MAGTPNRSGVNRDLGRSNSDPRATIQAIMAGIVALLGWAALIIDFTQALMQAADEGRSIAVFLLRYFSFFTILTNCGVAALMSVTAIALRRGRPPPPATWFRAALVYMVVTGVTYELLLRGLWSPRGLQFLSDLALHDLLPVALLVFWVGMAPKRGLAWRDLPWLLAFPTVYFAVTLVAGALGAGYPYDFLDAGRLGYPIVFVVGVTFILVFLALGALVTAMGRALTDDRWARASRRSSS